MCEERSFSLGITGAVGHIFKEDALECVPPPPHFFPPPSFIWAVTIVSEHLKFFLRGLLRGGRGVLKYGQHTKIKMGPLKVFFKTIKTNHEA